MICPKWRTKAPGRNFFPLASDDSLQNWSLVGCSLS